ncbi:MAG: hypothetical protein IJN39_00205 [Clostridia bacterium]|nr:hypothetical protein [Clostridia bacterium]
MKKIFLLLISALCLFMVCMQVCASEASVDAEFSYYINNSEIPTMIYTLESGSIKVHADISVKSPSGIEAQLVTNIAKNGTVIKTVKSDFIKLDKTVSHISTDIEITDASCSLESVIADKTGNILAKSSPFKKEENVIVPDPGKITEPISQMLTLTVNGKPVEVRREEMKGMNEGGSRDKASHYFNVAKVSVSLSSEITLELKGINGTVISEKWSVSPQKLDIPRVVSQGTGYIFIDKVQTLFVRNWATQSGEGYEDLIILVTPLEENVPYKYHPSITYYANGISTCPANPEFSKNQYVYFEKGYHDNVGAIALKPGMHLYMAPGAVLEAKIETKDVTENPDGILVHGRGILEARKSTNTGNKKSIYFENCKNVRIEGIGSRNAREWQTLYVNCSDFVIDNTNIMAILLNNDGIDLDGVDNFTITNNFVMSADDSFGWHGVDYEKIATSEHPFGRPTFNIAAKNNILYNLMGNAVRFGSSFEQEEMYNINITDTYVLTKNSYGVAITVHDWAYVHDVLIENFFIEEGTSTFNGVILVDVVQSSASRGNENRAMPEGLPSPYGNVKNITIKNLTSPWHGQKAPVSVGGCDENHKITNVIFENVIIQKGTPTYTGGKGTAPITLSDVNFNESTVIKDKTFVSEADITIK